MNNIKKVLSVWMLATCVLPVAAQYPVIPDSVKARRQTRSGVRPEIRCGMEESPSGCYGRSTKGRPYKPWASKPEDLVKSNIPAFPVRKAEACILPGGRGGKVIVVTSLEDSGPGTLREACETGGARVIVLMFPGYPFEGAYQPACSLCHNCRTDRSGRWYLCYRAFFSG